MRKKIFICVSIIVFILWVFLNLNYNQKSLESGVFMDISSYQSGESIPECHLDSIEPIELGKNSVFWFGCKIQNYSSPTLVRIYFPFEISIFSYGSCMDKIDTTNGNILENRCYEFNARVVNDTILEIVYDSSDMPFEQLKLSANIFRRVSLGEFVFKDFQINTNPLPFMSNGFVFAGSNIKYSLKFERDGSEIKSDKSNFIPSIENEFTGDFNYKRVTWNSADVSTEAIMYLNKSSSLKFKEWINYFLFTFLGFSLNELFGKFSQKKE